MELIEVTSESGVIVPDVRTDPSTDKRDPVAEFHDRLRARGLYDKLAAITHDFPIDRAEIWDRSTP